MTEKFQYQKFDLAALARMDDGRIAETLNQAIRRVRLDCEDRPALDAARKIKLTISIVPNADDAGNLDSVSVGFDIDEALPKRSSKNYMMVPRQGALLFNDLAPENPDQTTIPSLLSEDEEAAHAS